eukprot:3042796-Prymnesium_polylepis.1
MPAWQPLEEREGDVGPAELAAASGGFAISPTDVPCACSLRCPPSGRAGARSPRRRGTLRMAMRQSAPLTWA